GTNRGGDADLGNTLDGVHVLDTVGVVIDANLISGNDGHGVEVSRSPEFAGASSATITGNTIGLALNGVSVLANRTPNGGRGDGVNVNSGASATIGGITAAARNVISGNRRDGVRFDLAGPGNVVGGNFIGTDKNGSAVLGNGGDGVHGIGGGTSDGE